MIPETARILIIVGLLAGSSAMADAQTPTQTFDSGLADIRAERWEACVTKFRQVIAVEFSLPESHLNLGACLIRLKRTDEALAALEEAVRLRPAFGDAHAAIGDIHYDREDYARAVRAYREALRLRPKFIDLVYLGNAQGELGHYNEAIAAYVNAAELDPAKALPHIQIGNAHHRQNNYPAAIDAYKKAISLEPRNALAHLGLGTVYYDQQKYAESIPHYKRASELEESALAHQFLADAYRMTNQLGLAIDHYTLALGLDPKNADVIYGLGLCYAAQNNRVLARQQHGKLLPLDAELAGKLLAEINAIK